jgi:hypothetical protein
MGQVLQRGEGKPMRGFGIKAEQQRAQQGIDNGSRA